MSRLLCFAVAVLALAGCGGAAGPGRPESEVTLLLGGPPEAVHAGIFLATERGYDEAEGIELTIRRNGDAPRLLRAGRVQAALLNGADLPGSGAVCVLALVQLPEPEHFLCVTPSTLADRRPEVEALVRTLQRGYSETGIDPQSAVQAILTRAGGLDRATVAAQLDAVAATFEAGVPAFGYLRRDALPPGEFDTTLVGPTSRD